jgi:hypothetical protein
VGVEYPIKQRIKDLGGLTEETALVLSIEKWEQNLNLEPGDSPSTRDAECGLCLYHYVDHRQYDADDEYSECGNCPLAYGVLYKEDLGCSSYADAPRHTPYYSKVMSTLDMDGVRDGHHRYVIRDDPDAYYKACGALVNRLKRALKQVREKQHEPVH